MHARAEPGAHASRAAKAPAAPAPQHAAALLSGQIGNRAVGSLVRSLQRKPSPPDYTQDVKNVEKTSINRLVVRNLEYGIDGFRSRYGDDESVEATKTKQSPKRMAVVLVPDTFKADQPTQVILHFHGWGFRSFDPYAGYTVAQAGSGQPAGSVRDVHLEHWEQQIAALKGSGPQVVAILAQGRGKSEFGTFPTFEYVRDVLLKSGDAELAALAGKESYSVILSGHSGGGPKVVRDVLNAGKADTAKRTALTPQALDPKKGRVVDRLQPVDLVVLYEAINVDEQASEVMTWVDQQIARLGAALKAAPENAAVALAATPVLRGYFGKRKSGYARRYRYLACKIEKSVRTTIPAQFQVDACDRFRIVEVAGPGGGDVEHEQVISGTGPDPSKGSLADALRAQRDPKSDRAQAVKVDDCDKLIAEFEADIRARARARAKALKDKQEKEKAGAVK